MPKFLDGMRDKLGMDPARKLHPALRAQAFESRMRAAERADAAESSADASNPGARRTLRRMSSRMSISLPAAFVEKKSTFRGDRVGFTHFLTQFPDVIFRIHGSVLPKIIVELVMSFAAGFNFFLEGQDHLNMLMKTCRNIAIEILGSVPAGGLSEEGATVVLCAIRRLKLYYYAVVEHLRSNEGYDVWLDAHAMVLRFASHEEVQEFELEFGSPTKGRDKVRVPTDVNAASISQLMRSDAYEESFRRRTEGAPSAEDELRESTRRTLRETHNQAARRCSCLVMQQAQKKASSPLQLPRALTGLAGTGNGTGGADGSGERSSSADGLQRRSRKTASCQSFFDRVSGASTSGDSNEELSEGSIGRTSKFSSPSGQRHIKRISQGAVSTAGAVSRAFSNNRGKREARFEFKDPTTSKPMIIALYLRRDIQQIGAMGLLNAPQLAAFSTRVDDMIESYLGMNKIDKLILPLPYSQLLKIFSLFFVFTVPFVLAPTVGIFTPFVTFFLAMGYFGLDQVGAELERPFGVGQNDLPLLEIGSDLCRSLDTLVRGLAREIRAKQAEEDFKREREARHQNQKANLEAAASASSGSGNPSPIDSTSDRGGPSPGATRGGPSPGATRKAPIEESDKRIHRIGVRTSFDLRNLEADLQRDAAEKKQDGGEASAGGKAPAERPAERPAGSMSDRGGLFGWATRPPAPEPAPASSSSGLAA